MAVLAADEQGKYMAMYDKVFQNTKKLKREDLDKYAAEAGLNMAKYKAYMDANKGEATIAAHQKLARSLGATGTPAFFINGRNLSGAQPQASFEKVVDEELKKAKALISKGIPRSRVYAETIKNGLTAVKYLPGSDKPKARPAPGAGPRKTVKVSPADPYKGAKVGKVTVVEWTDYQ